MAIHLSEHFSYRKLLRATLPSILMMVFTSIYGIVDGFFVSNFAGKTAFSAINLFIPVTMVIGALGFMMGSGGAALVSKTLGEGDKEKANKIFSMVVYTTIIMGVVVSAIVFPLVEQISRALGASEDMLPYCVTYGRILIAGQVFYMIQTLFQTFFTVAEKPMLGFIVTVIAGVTNMILDALFIAGFSWGVAGAAVATVISQIVGSIIPLIYFFRKNTSLLQLCKTRFDFKILLKSATNGSSEFLSNVSGSIVSMVYNIQLLAYAGEDGVAAYGVLMYVGFIFTAIYLGYSIGVAPIVGYNYGAENKEELRNVYHKSLIINGIFGVAMTIVAVSMATPLSYIFVGYDSELLSLTSGAMRIYGFCFLFMGFNIFASSFFTALNNGLISALISGLRTLVFQIAAVLLLPLLLGVNGIWGSLIVAEAIAIILSFIFLLANRKRYEY